MDSADNLDIVPIPVPPRRDDGLARSPQLMAGLQCVVDLPPTQIQPLHSNAMDRSMNNMQRLREQPTTSVVRRSRRYRSRSSHRLFEYAYVDLHDLTDLCGFILKGVRRHNILESELQSEIQETLVNILSYIGDPFQTEGRVDRTVTEPPRTVECNICCSSLPNACLIPCFHVICMGCADKLDKCPFCRKKILYRKRLRF